MKIPATFQLVNTTWRVTRMSDDIAEAGSAEGDCCRRRCEIRLHLSPDNDTEDVYCHELSHALLEFTTRPKLAKDERFVQSLGEVLCQYMNSAKGTFDRS